MGLLSGVLQPLLTPVDGQFAVALLLKVTTLLGLAWLVHLALLRRNPRLRVLLWRFVAVGLLMLPSISWLAPGLTVDLGPSRMFFEQPVFDTSTRLRNDAHPTPFDSAVRIERLRRTRDSVSIHDEQWLQPVRESDSTARESFGKDDLAVAATILWLAGGCCWLLRLLIGFHRVQRIVRLSDITPSRVQNTCDAVRASLDVSRPVQVRQSETINVPFLVGVWKPTLLLPKRMCREKFRNDLFAVLAHEFSHVGSADPNWNLLLHLVSIPLWFHPFAWRIRVSHEAACETVCDAVAAEYIGDVSTYSRVLARVAVDASRVRPAAGLAMARTSRVRQRIQDLKRGGFIDRLTRRLYCTFVGIGTIALMLIGTTRIGTATAAELDQVVERTLDVSRQANAHDDPKHQQRSSPDANSSRKPTSMATSATSVKSSAGIEGLWAVDSFERAGRADNREVGGQFFFTDDLVVSTMTDRSFGAYRAGSGFVATQYDIIETATPGQIDFQIVGERNRPLTLECIFRRQHNPDRLSLCAPASPSHARPSRFVSTGVEEQTLVVLSPVTRTTEQQRQDEQEHQAAVALQKLGAEIVRGIDPPWLAHILPPEMPKRTSAEKEMEFQRLQMKFHLFAARNGSTRWEHSKLAGVLLDTCRDYDAAMTQVRGLPHIEELRFRSPRLTDAHLRTFAETNGLRELDLYYGNVTDEGLAQLSQLTNLEVLELGYTKISDAGLVHLKSLTRLEQVGLIGTNVTDVGLRHLEGLTNLRSLSLCRTSITDEGLVHLTNLSNLHELDLSETPITDEGVTHLKRLKRLESVNLLETRVTASGVNTLGRLLPRVRIKSFHSLEQLPDHRDRASDAGEPAIQVQPK